MASHEATLTPVVPGDRERAAGTLAAHMPAGRIAAIEAVAKIEHRTVSAMVNLSGGRSSEISCRQRGAGRLKSVSRELPSKTYIKINQ